MYGNINFDAVLARLKESRGLAANKEVAEIFGLSAPDFSRRKKKGTLLPLLIGWALDNQVNIDWLLTGRSPATGDGWEHGGVREAGSGYGLLQVDLLIAILEAVETDLNQRKLALPVQKKAKAIALLYEFYLGASKPIDPATVGRYLDLAAEG